jgi:hypothetical protein
MQSLKYSFLVFVLAFFAVTSANAQGQVSIYEDPDVAALMNRFISSNKASEGIDGWRIQIMATTDRSKMEEAKKLFLTRFPQHTAAWRFDAPHYKLRVGAFQTKAETRDLLTEIQGVFPSAYEVRDKIKLSELLP